MSAARPDSARKRQLLDAAYDYVIERGLTELSLSVGFAFNLNESTKKS